MEVQSQIGLIGGDVHATDVRVVAVFRKRSEPERVAGIEPDVARYLELVVGGYGSDPHVSGSAYSHAFGVVRTERKRVVGSDVHDHVGVLPGLHIEHLPSFRIRNMEHGDPVSSRVVRVRPHDDPVAAHNVELVSGGRYPDSHVSVREREIRQTGIERL